MIKKIILYFYLLPHLYDITIIKIKLRYMGSPLKHVIDCQRLGISWPGNKIYKWIYKYKQMRK